MSEVTKKPKRRWLRFSLRSFLIVVIFLSAWIGWNMYRVERQRDAVRWVRMNGGVAYYDYQIDSEGYFLHDDQPPVPNWLLNILDVNYFSSVVEVNNSDAGQITDLTPLADLENLERLHLSGTQVSDLTPLTGLTNLESLILRGTQVSDLQPLAGLKKLNWLLLERTHVSSLKPLSDLKNLKQLWLFNDSQVDQKEIEELQQALPKCDIRF